MPQYQILRMDKLGTPPVEDGGGPMTFNDPAEAAAMSKKLSDLMGEKLCVKPIVNELWRRREEKRFLSGEYRPLPWVGDAWWNSPHAHPIWKDHYPHASLEKPGWVAYTKSVEDGTKDKQSLLRPGAYLKRYFERAINGYGMNERRLVELFMTMYGPIDIKFATTEDEMERVYDLLHTCLYGRAWPNDIHPVRTYAFGDLQIAYIGDLAAGKVSARALVWPERKLHSRVYGDVARLQNGLERLGYTWGAPIGAKIKRIQLRQVKVKVGQVPQGCFLVPYIDKRNQQGGGHLSVIDKGEHLEICAEGEKGSHHAGLPDGRSGIYVPRDDEYPVYRCEHCGNKQRELYPVFECCPNEDNEEPENMMWCAGCRAVDAWQCGYSGNWYIKHADREEVGGMWWAPYYADMYAARCEGNGRLYSSDALMTVHSADGTHKKMSNDYCKAHGGLFKSQLTSRYFMRSDVTHFYGAYADKYVCAKSELKHHTFQCDGCDKHWQLQYRFSHGDDRLYCSECEYKRKETGKFPVSQSRKKFDNERELNALPKLPLQAAE